MPWGALSTCTASVVEAGCLPDGAVLREQTRYREQECQAILSHWLDRQADETCAYVLRFSHILKKNADGQYSQVEATYKTARAVPKRARKGKGKAVDVQHDTEGSDDAVPQPRRKTTVRSEDSEDGTDTPEPRPKPRPKPTQPVAPVAGPSKPRAKPTQTEPVPGPSKPKVKKAMTVAEAPAPSKPPARTAAQTAADVQLELEELFEEQDGSIRLAQADKIMRGWRGQVKRAAPNIVLASNRKVVTVMAASAYLYELSPEAVYRKLYRRLLPRLFRHSPATAPLRFAPWATWEYSSAHLPLEMHRRVSGLSEFLAGLENIDVLEVRFPDQLLLAVGMVLRDLATVQFAKMDPDEDPADSDIPPEVVRSKLAFRHIEDILGILEPKIGDLPEGVCTLRDPEYLGAQVAREREGRERSVSAGGPTSAVSGPEARAVRCD